jgi:hypothetical protein
MYHCAQPNTTLIRYGTVIDMCGIYFNIQCIFILRVERICELYSISRLNEDDFPM